MLRHIFGRPDEDDREEWQPPGRPRMMRVRLATSSGGARWVELPRDQVEGRTPREILEAAIQAIEERSASSSGAEAAADLLFAQDARRLMSEQGFALDAFSQERWMPPNTRLSDDVLAEELFLEMGVDHRAGG